MMRKILSVLLSIVLAVSLITITSYAVAVSDTKVAINGETVMLKSALQIEKGRILVPLNGVFEKLNAEVNYDKTSKKITIEDKYTTVELTLGEKQALVYKKYDFTGLPLKAELEALPKLINDQVYIPLRFVAESLGVTVEWDGKTRTANLSTQSDITPVESPVDYTIVTESAIQGNARLETWFQENSQTKGTYFYTVDNATYVLISAGEKPTGGYSLSVESATMVRPGYVYITAKLNKPSKDDIVTMALTYPNLLLKIDQKVDKVEGDIQE